MEESLYDYDYLPEPVLHQAVESLYKTGEDYTQIYESESGFHVVGLFQHPPKKFKGYVTVTSDSPNAPHMIPIYKEGTCIGSYF